MRKKVFTIILILSFYTSVVFTQTIINYKKSNSELPSNNIISIYIDEYNNKWLGTDEGLVYFGNNNDWKIYTTDDKLADNKINDIAYELSDFGSELWLATDNGASVAAFNVDGITAATSYTTETSDIRSNKINAVVVDVNHNRWFGDDTVLCSFTGSTWDFSYGEVEQGYPGGAFKAFPILCIGTSYVDSISYFGTEGAGVGRFNRDDIDGITGPSFYDTDWSGLQSDNIYAVYVDENGYQWFGTDKGLAYHFNTLTKENWERVDTSNGLVNNFVKAIARDNDDVFWFGTKGGVSSYKDENFIKNYTIEDGLLSNNINDIAIDNNGNVWLATNNGISVLNFSDGTDNTSINKITKFQIKSYPNPAIESTSISFKTIRNGYVDVAIINSNGKITKQLYYGYMKMGKQHINGI